MNWLVGFFFGSFTTQCFFCTSINDLASSNRRSAASRSDSALKSKTDFLKNLEHKSPSSGFSCEERKFWLESQQYCGRDYICVCPNKTKILIIDDPGLAPMVVAVCQRHSYSGSKPGGRVSRLIRISFPQNDRVKKDFEKMKRQMFEIRQGFHLKGNVSAFEMIWPKESIWSLLLVFTGDF